MYIYKFIKNTLEKINTLAKKDSKMFVRTHFELNKIFLL